MNGTSLTHGVPLARQFTDRRARAGTGSGCQYDLHTALLSDLDTSTYSMRVVLDTPAVRRARRRSLPMHERSRITRRFCTTDQ